MIVLLIAYAMAMIAFLAVGARFAWRWYRRRGLTGKHTPNPVKYPWSG